MPGIVELAEDVFLKPVRVAVPAYDGSLADVMHNPRFSTVMGLLSEARLQRARGRKVAQQKGSFRTLLARLKEWFMHSGARPDGQAKQACSRRNFKSGACRRQAVPLTRFLTITNRGEFLI